MRVLFTAQDSRTIRDAFAGAKPNSEYASLYAAAVARRQADQIYNLSLTRTATVVLGRGARGVIGVGRVKTPTLAIVGKRELEIRNFVPVAYFEVVATANVNGGQFRMRHAPQERIVRREIAQDVVNAARGFEGPLGVRVEEKRQGPPKLHDLPSLQKRHLPRRNTRYQAGATPYLGRTFTGWIAPASPGAPLIPSGSGLCDNCLVKDSATPKVVSSLAQRVLTLIKKTISWIRIAFLARSIRCTPVTLGGLS
jgi:DNA topoisomerase